MNCRPSSSRSDPSSQVHVIVTADPNNQGSDHQQQLSYRIQSGSPRKGAVLEEAQTEPSSSCSSRPPDPRFAQTKRRTSHTLLYVPNRRRVSTASGNSTASCPTECSEDSDDARQAAVPASMTSNCSLSSAQGNGHLYIQNAPVKFSLTPSPAQCRRKSVQTGAPAIGFRPLNRTFDRRASQPTIHVEPSLVVLRCDNLESAHSKNSAQSALADSIINKRNMLTKRVSWLSMKSLQDSVDPLVSGGPSKPRKRPSSDNMSGKNVLESKTNSQFGSVMQLDDGVEFESDTPPLDTLSWSCAGYGVMTSDFSNVTPRRILGPQSDPSTYTEMEKEKQE